MSALHHKARQPQIDGVTIGSLQHAVLRLLAATELSAANLKNVLADGQAYTARDLHRKALEPLREMGLILTERNTIAAVWAATAHGAEVARRLGPFGMRHQYAQAAIGPSAVATAANDGPPVAISASSRRRLTLGTGDRLPPKLRPGSADAAALPSRVGRWLQWPDGTRTPA